MNTRILFPVMMIGLLFVVWSAVPGFTHGTGHWACPLGVQKSAGDISYLSGGADFDINSSAKMDRRSSVESSDQNFNVALRLFDKNGELKPYNSFGGETFGQPIVTIQGMDNKSFLRTASCGSKFMASLPQGRYLISVAYQGHIQTREITAGESAKNIDLHFPVV